MAEKLRLPILLLSITLILNTSCSDEAQLAEQCETQSSCETTTETKTNWASAGGIGAGVVALGALAGGGGGDSGGGGGSEPNAVQSPTLGTPITEFPSGLQKSYLPQTVEGSSQQREYLVRYPSQPNQSNYPLVFYFHGNGDTAEDFYKSLHEVHELIDNNQFIGIFPQGLEKSWNLGAEASKADDVAWVLGIIDEISEISFVDSSSAYAVGISNGAGVVNQLAKETSSLKGIAPIVSQQTLELSIINPFRGVSVFQINGDDDPLIPLQGGFSQVQHQFVSARESAENWALHSKCATVPVTFEDVWGFYPVQAFVYGNCESNQQVRYHIVEGSGHSGNFGNFALHTAIWNFFRKFPGGD